MKPLSGYRLTLARSLLGARTILALITLAALLPPVAVAGGSGAEGLGALPWRVGGRVGFTADAASFPDSDGYTLDVYVRVPPATLAAIGRDSLNACRLRISLSLQSGNAHEEREQQFKLAVGDTGGFGKVVVFRMPARTGRQKLKVKLEDLLSYHRGLLYTGRQVTYSETLEGEFTLPRAQMERDLSDIEFIWSEDSLVVSPAFRRAPHALLPNPERLYGLLSTDLRASFLARARRGDERPWHWVMRILDQEDKSLAVRESTGAAGRWLNVNTTIDVSTLPAGGYDLEVKAWQEGDAGALLRRARFSVAWQIETWLRNARDVEDYVYFLLDPQSEETFDQLQPGEQERYLEDYWVARDPTPGTAENEARTAYLQRVETANQLYGRFGIGKGMFSDMGRVFIRYGEPSEKLHQVIPTGDETLTQVIQQLSLTEDQPIGEVGKRGPGGDTRPFEIWIYEGEIPTPPDADPRVASHPRHKRLIFLFVDEQGLGAYTLRYSTE